MGLWQTLKNPPGSTPGEVGTVIGQVLVLGSISSRFRQARQFSFHFALAYGFFSSVLIGKRSENRIAA